MLGKWFRGRVSWIGWHYLTPLRAGILVAVVLSVSRISGCLYLDLIDVRAMDFRLMQRGEIEPGPEVAIVAVDNDSIDQIGRWPWPRAAIAHLLDEIVALDPAVVGFDITFSESSSFAAPAGVRLRPESIDDSRWQQVQSTLKAQDEQLVDSIRRSERTVLGYFFEQYAEQDRITPEDVSTYDTVMARGGGERFVEQLYGARTNLPAFTKAASDVGYYTIIPDARDGFVRLMPLVLRAGDKMVIPLSLAMLRVYRPDARLHIGFAEEGVQRVRFGDIDIPVSENGRMVLNYRGPGHTFPHYSAIDILTKKVPPDSLRGKLVLLGVTATAVADIRVTAFDDVFPGVEIHATALDNILRQDFISQPRILVLPETAILFVLVLVLGIGLRRMRGAMAAGFAFAVFAVYLVLSQVVFVSRGLPFSIVYPTLAVIVVYLLASVYHYVTEEREKRKLRRLLDLYLSPNMAQLVSEHPETLRLGGEKRDMTVVFSDLRGFTSFSEKLPPERLVEFLNIYFEAMTDVLFHYDGALDKYIGDGMMAFWGAPLPQPDHAARALRSSIEMVARTRALNEEWKARGWPWLEVCVGLNSGQMVFGNMGSMKRLSLTVMGDNVNLAARLEPLNRMYETSIIASEATLTAAPNIATVREIDLVRVKGREEPVRIYEVLGTAEEGAQWDRILEPFHSGLQAYREQRWSQALDAFAAVLEAAPGDGPATLYSDRCRFLQANPPEADWNGVTVMETK
jgi:adenylate cyclase